VAFNFEDFEDGRPQRFKRDADAFKLSETQKLKLKEYRNNKPVLEPGSHHDIKELIRKRDEAYKAMGIDRQKLVYDAMKKKEKKRQEKAEKEGKQMEKKQLHQEKIAKAKQLREEKKAKRRQMLEEKLAKKQQLRDEKAAQRKQRQEERRNKQLQKKQSKNGMKKKQIAKNLEKLEINLEGIIRHIQSMD